MSTRDKLNEIASRRILILDGAMGTQIQNLGLTEADFRGSRFAGHKIQLTGCNDLLCLTQPEKIGAIHEAYLKAGADIIETCSFNSTAVSLADYGLEGLAYEISRAAAGVARKAADKFSTQEKPRFVAGSLGPTGKSAGLSPDINDPGKRTIYWDELEAAYYDNARGLLDGGADIFIIETIFDTINAKAALFAISRLMNERNMDIPIMISATVSGNSGRILSGQTLEAFFVSVLHSPSSGEGALWAIGLNCSFGAEKLLPFIRSLAAAVNKQDPCLISVHPNAGLPNQLGNYDETPETMAALIEKYLQEDLLNIVGGCCGTTPEHISAIAAKAALYKPKGIGMPKKSTAISGVYEKIRHGKSPKNGHCYEKSGLALASLAGDENDKSHKSRLFLSGLELVMCNPTTHYPLPTTHLTLIGERTNVSGSKKFLRLISEGKYNETLTFARSTIEDGADVLNVGMDDAMLDAEKSMCAFLYLALSDPDIAKVPVMLDSSR